MSIYNTITACWSDGNSDRPSFLQLCDKLEHMTKLVQSHLRDANEFVYTHLSNPVSEKSSDKIVV